MTLMSASTQTWMSLTELWAVARIATWDARRISARCMLMIWASLVTRMYPCRSQYSITAGSLTDDKRFPDRSWNLSEKRTTLKPAVVNA